MTTNVPPIKIWILVLVTFCLLQLIVIIYYNNPKHSSVNENSIISQLSDMKRGFAGKDKTTYKVVIIGSSLVANGVACPDEIEGILADYQTKNIVLNKIWKPNDQFKQLVEKNKIINELLLVKPDLVCFQTELAAIGYSEIEKHFYTDFQNYMQTLAFRNTTFVKDIFKNERVKFIKCKDNFIDFEVVEDSLKYMPVKRYVKDSAAVQFVLDQLKVLKNAGIKVVLADIPRPQQVEKIMYREPFKRDLIACLNMYKHEMDVPLWKYTGIPMYFKYFYDGGHLNKEGRYLFTKNLLEKIIKEMATRK